MKTAVEFLELMFLRIITFDSEIQRKKYKDVIRQAKEIEKEQIVKAHGNQTKKSGGISNATYILTGEQYYNETFKNK
jgi:hypothetical protein